MTQNLMEKFQMLIYLSAQNKMRPHWKKMLWKACWSKTQKLVFQLLSGNMKFELYGKQMNFHLSWWFYLKESYLVR